MELNSKYSHRQTTVQVASTKPRTSPSTQNYRTTGGVGSVYCLLIVFLLGKTNKTICNFGSKWSVRLSHRHILIRLCCHDPRLVKRRMTGVAAAAAETWGPDQASTPMGTPGRSFLAHWSAWTVPGFVSLSVRVQCRRMCS